MALAGVVRRDIELALEIAKSGAPRPHEYEVVKGNREVMEELVRQAELHPEWTLGWDIETPRSFDKADDESEIDSIQAQVTQIQFAWDSRRGYVFPGFETEWVKEGTRKLLGLGHRKYTWNGKGFDHKVVEGHHYIPILGESIDLMEAWSWVQPDLPKGLQFATSFYAPNLGPWKHLAFDKEERYGACDVISLHLNAEGIFKVMDQRGLRTSFDRHVGLLTPIMVAASRRGFPVDGVKHAEFGNKIYAQIAEINSQIQGLIPDECRKVGPRKKEKGRETAEFGYVGVPPAIREYLGENGNPIEDLGVRMALGRPDGENLVCITKDKVVLEEKLEDDETGEVAIKEVTYTRRNLPRFNKDTLEFDTKFRWCQLYPFSSSSGPQKLAYIAFKREQEIQERIIRKRQTRTEAERLCKYKIPKVRNKQKELKDNTGAKEMEKLFKETGDPVFKHLVEIGKLKKLHGTYIQGWKEKLRGGVVHTTFKLAGTATGQLASVDPNIQNYPKRGDLATELRGVICAKPGKVLIEFDKKSFHAQTLAFEAKDKVYARISAIDPHSFMTAHRLRLPEAPELLKWSDSDLKGWFEERKADKKTVYKGEAITSFPNGMTFEEIRDYKSKNVILGIGFCQGATSLQAEHPESYKSKKEVQEFLDLFFDTFPQVWKYQKEIAQSAHKQTYLISRWGYIRRFHDVFQWDSKKWNHFTGSMGDWRPGDDYEASVAFNPANDAFGMLKEEMLRMGGYRISQEQIFNVIMESVQDLKSLWPSKEANDLLERYGFCNQIHDSLFFHCDGGLKDRCIEDILTIMREPCPTLFDPEMAPNGLFVDASCKIAEDWGSMKGVKV